VILSRKLAQAYQYPAVDVLQSVSRLGVKVSTKAEQEDAGKVRKLLATYAEAEDLINVGAYVKGSNRDIDEAVERIDRIREFLRQDISERADIETTLARLRALTQPVQRQAENARNARNARK
jgi:flagellum-specific ATP synthase